jgi:hypothetical protein
MNETVEPLRDDSVAFAATSCVPVAFNSPRRAEKRLYRAFRRMFGIGATPPSR